MRLDDVARDAELLDALAGGRSTDDPTLTLLASLREPPDRPVVRQRRGRQGHRLGVVVVATVLSSGIGVAAAASTSHPGDLFYPVHRAVLGRTADDPVPATALLDRAQRVVDHAATHGRLDLATRTHALALVDEAQRRLPSLKVRDATPLAHRAAVLRRAATFAPGPDALRHHHHSHHHPRQVRVARV